MTLDWDGKIRMDCSSPYAMASLIARQHEFAVATGNDTDADRHGIVTPDGGLMNPNHYLAVAIDYLYQVRDGWPAAAAVGKTLVSSSMIDRVTRGPGPGAAGGAGRVQVVRAGAAGRVGGVRRRGERRGVVPAARRVGLDDGQGRDHPGPAGRGDHGRDRATRRPSGTTDLTRRYGEPGLRADRHRGHPGAEGGAGPAVAGPGLGQRARGRADHRGADHRARQRGADRRAQGGGRLGLVRGPPVGHRGRLQAVRRVVPRARAPGRHPGAGAGDHRGRDRVSPTTWCGAR